MRENDESARWNHTPEIPIEASPLFRWPVRPLDVLRWWWGAWFLVSEKLLIAAIAVLSWLYLQPSLETMASIGPGWVAAMWLRNAALMTLVAGGLHLWLYAARGQGDRLRHDTRDVTRGRAFTLGRQVWDNMFWTLASGVTVWTAYEALMLHAFARGWLEPLSFSAHPVWFVAIFFLVPIWESFWFYLIHRALHWPPTSAGGGHHR